MDLEELLAGGESLDVVFKSKVNDSALVEAAACMANGVGGFLLVGVEDDGVVVGAVRPDGRPYDPHMVASLIQNKTDPPLPVRARIEKHAQGEVLVIKIPADVPGPVGTKAGLFTRRAIGGDGRPQCRPMTPHELVTRAYEARGIDYASAPAAGATFDHLDHAEFERFRRLCARPGGDAELSTLDDRDICMALGLIPPTDPVSLGMVLLFGTEDALRRWVPTCEVLFQDLREGHGANESLKWPLLRLAEEISVRLEIRNSVSEFTMGLHRIEIPLLPELLRRESVANALVHRDYSQLGPISIQISSDEFTIANPGGFPFGVTLHNILEQSRPRSVKLADAFKRAGLVERKGKGVNDMFEAQLRVGRDVPDFSRSTSQSVVLSAPLGTSDADLVRFILAMQDRRQENLSLNELRIVHEIRAASSATAIELADFAALPLGVVRAATGRLIELGIVEGRGAGVRRRFHLTPQFYELAADRAAYVRARPLDDVQREQMVLDYVGAYGRVTRGQVADLCHLTPVEARRTLRRLVDRQALELRGERRGAHYVLPDRPTPPR